MNFRTREFAPAMRLVCLVLIGWPFGAAHTFAQTGISVTITPGITGLTIRQTIALTATVTNDSQNRGVTWSANGGAFSAMATASGVATIYTAPTTAGVYFLTATSVTDPSKNVGITFGVTDLAGVFTYHNDLMRDGANTSEYALTPANVSSTTFGKLFSCTVDGAIYAQPLWVANLTVNGTSHNVVFVATQHDSLYAFEADVNATPCAPLWHVSLIDAAHGGSSSETTVPGGPTGNYVGQGDGDITPEVGVTGTPVINPTTNTLYVVSKSVIPSGSPATSTLYQSERYGPFSYQFKVPNGSYNVLLKFAEIYWTQTGQRIFSVAINGTQVLTNFDIVAAAGAPFTAVDKTFPVTVTNGLVTIQFIPGSVDLPKVSAIEVH
jgi:hypothetical protein